MKQDREADRCSVREPPMVLQKKNYDRFDGANDGRINFYINYPSGVARGTWYYEVYSDRVTGTQTYSI